MLISRQNARTARHIDIRLFATERNIHSAFPDTELFQLPEQYRGDSISRVDSERF
jgi:hypothetical protein